MVLITSQIRQQLRRYLDGELNYEPFWDWLGAQKPRVNIGSPEQALLYRIIGRFYEYDRGVWDDEQIIDKLEELVAEERMPGVTLLATPAPVWLIALSPRPAVREHHSVPPGLHLPLRRQRAVTFG
jgi:hypothetical protein